MNKELVNHYNKLQCQICGRKFKNNTSLGIHIGRYEDITVKEYYDLYIKKYEEGICCCGKETTFLSIGFGYHEYCSRKCSSSSIKTLEKSRQTYKEKTGYSHPHKNPKIKKKWKQTNLERTGYENPFQNPDILEKMKQTCKEKTGYEHSSQNPEIIERTKIIIKNNFYNKLLNSNRLKNKVTPLFTLDDYKGIKNKYLFKCNICNNEFFDNLDNGKIPRCLICYPILNGFSLSEKEISEFCKQYYPGLIENFREIISPYELDIYIPELNLAIEFNGLYWHSELNGKDRNYHLNKYLLCKEKNIKLIQIFEDEWVNKSNIIKSILLEKFNKLPNIMDSNECIIKEINNNDAIIFLENNHIDGQINSDINIGLFYNNELVSLLSLNKIENENYEILRLCNKLNTSIHGSFSKLFKCFKDKYMPKIIITYSDLRYCEGNSYINLKFKHTETSKPNYYYINDYSQRFSRLKFKKYKLLNILESYDENLSEWENALLNGYDRIWDCGNDVYEWKI